METPARRRRSTSARTSAATCSPAREQSEFNYQGEGRRDQFTRYKGKDGVTLSNFVRRAAFALRFGRHRPADLGPDRLRTPRSSSSATSAPASTKLAPFLRFDADPYPVVLGNRTAVGDGRLHRQPTGTRTRSRSTGEGGLADGVQLRAQLGEGDRRRLRGHRHLLRVRREGPDHPAWRKAFPDLFTDKSRDARGARASTCATPRTCSRSQSNHVRPLPRARSRKRFYDGSATWLVSPDPGSGIVGADDARRRVDDGSVDVAVEQPAPGGHSTGAPDRPLLPLHQAPGRLDTSTSWCSSRSCPCRRATAADAPGVVPRRQLRSRASTGSCSRSTMPQGQNVEGPVQVNNNIIRTRPIAQAITLLNQQGSQVIQGSLQLIPVGNSIIYVRPFYAQGRSRAATRCSSSWSCTPRATARCAARRCNDGLDQLLRRPGAGAHQLQPVRVRHSRRERRPATRATATTRRGPPPRPRPGATTTTTAPPRPGSGAGAARPGRRAASTRRRGRAPRRATSASTSSSSKQAQDARAAGRRAGVSGSARPRRDRPAAWGSARGLLLWRVVEIPPRTGFGLAAPHAEGVHAWPFPGSTSASTSSAGTTAPTTTSTRPRRASTRTSSGRSRTRRASRSG